MVLALTPRKVKDSHRIIQIPASIQKVSLVRALLVIEFLENMRDPVSYVLIPEREVVATIPIEIFPLQILLVQIKHNPPGLSFMIELLVFINSLLHTLLRVGVAKEHHTLL
jgi:hypothetical protein